MEHHTHERLDGSAGPDNASEVGGGGGGDATAGQQRRAMLLDKIDLEHITDKADRKLVEAIIWRLYTLKGDDTPRITIGRPIILGDFINIIAQGFDCKISFKEMETLQYHDPRVKDVWFSPPTAKNEKGDFTVQVYLQEKFNFKMQTDQALSEQASAGGRNARKRKRVSDDQEHYHGHGHGHPHAHAQSAYDPREMQQRSPWPQKGMHPGAESWAQHADQPMHHAQHAYAGYHPPPQRPYDQYA